MQAKDARCCWSDATRSSRFTAVRGCFPAGGSIRLDYAAGTGETVVAARHAAVREAREEAGLVLRPEALVLVSRWITPTPLPKRFDTWFFAGRGSDAPVEVDGGEIHDHRWVTPRQALAAQQAGEIELPPPTFVTITVIAEHRRVADALAAFASRPLETFEPRLVPVERGAVTLYAGDAAYADGELERPGPRHRLWMREDGWRYERSE